MHKPIRPKAPPADIDRPSSAKRGYDARWRKLRMTVYVRDEGRCTDCRRVVGKGRNAHVDHIKAKRHGGSDAMSNLQLLCASCHSRKTWAEVRQNLEPASQPQYPKGVGGSQNGGLIREGPSSLHENFSGKSHARGDRGIGKQPPWRR